jgi:hypothetical protein
LNYYYYYYYYYFITHQSNRFTQPLDIEIVSGLHIT